MKNNNKKIVITGGAGFIGSNLAEKLVDLGYNVTIVDNLSQGKKERCPHHSNLIVEDIKNYNKLLEIFKDTDTVFHVAAIPRVPYSIEYPLETNEANITGTLNVLMAAKESGVRRVVYSASSSAYGEQKIMPLTEEMTPKPVHPYGIQKYVGELYCRVFSDIYNLETVCLRYFNVYGRHQNPDGPYAGVVVKFLKNRKLNLPLTIVGDGLQSRDFTHVSDVVNANILAMESANVGKGEVLNVGYGKNITVLELANMIGGELKYEPERKEAKHSLADISKIKKLIGWEPKVKIEDGLEDLKKSFGIKN
ncbi:MAG: NAD-dependent epimerase/dehydratase family protein [Candidatus Nomurabacteria bacterium]|nr:MAG: NAD-dependent epimerase/dehydratase family protein [Candidatus Nomurabacteria bacterium]